MRDWGLPFPLFVRSARGATLLDATASYADFLPRGHRPMFGHSPARWREHSLRRRRWADGDAYRGGGSPESGAALAERFALPCWQLTQRQRRQSRGAALGARHHGRRDVLVFNGATTARWTRPRCAGRARGAARAGLRGMPSRSRPTPVWNSTIWRPLAGALGDSGLRRAVRPGMTNMGVVLPEPGFHTQLRRLTARRARC